MKFVKPKNLPQKAFDVWEEVFNANKKEVGEERAAKIAWAAVKRGWKKVGDKWVRKKASEMKIPHKFFGSVTDLAGLDLDPVSDNVSEIEILTTGVWHHPIYGELEITPKRLERFKKNFDDGVRKAIAIDIEHKSDEGAVGWVKNLTIKDNSLYALVEWTPEGVQLIRNKKYRFFSPEFDDIYEDPKTGQEFRDVLIGGALTNRPFLQDLREIVLSEKYAEWTRKYINDLPDSAFLYIEPGGEKDSEGKTKPRSLRHFPYKDKSGKVDLPHLRNALARIPQSNLSDSVKSKVTAKAKKIAKQYGIGDSKKKGGEKSEKTMAEKKKEVKKKKAPTKLTEKKVKKLSKKGVEGKKDKKVKTITLTEDQLDKLEKSAEEGRKALQEVRRMRLTKTLNEFVYSEDNPDGVLLPKSRKLAKKLLFSLGVNQRKAFIKLLESLPKVRIFSEMGVDVPFAEEEAPPKGVDDYSWKLAQRAKKLQEEKPKTYKTLRDAMFAAEKQLSEEGIRPE